MPRVDDGGPASGATSEGTSDREIVVSRVIQGPQRLVFEAFTDAEHLGHWWGPNGFTTTTHTFDLRVGGEWEFIMHGPDGTDYPNHVQWLEIIPPERLVYLQGERKDDPQSFTATVTLVERGPRATEVTLRALFRTRARRDEVVERYGAIEGGEQALARLDAHVASLRGRTSTLHPG
jgi:uncharacterized protein YndB with AHSA1/START domain